MEIKVERSIINASSNPVSSFFIGFTALLLIIALNHWLFAQYFKHQHINSSYLHWYLSNSAAIGIGSALFSTIWGVLDNHPETVSAHPMKFVATYLRLVGMFLLTLQSGLRGHNERAPDFDSIVGLLLAAILFVVIVLGLLVVGPLQYFVFLVCGSLARFVSRSDQQIILRETSRMTELQTIRVGGKIPADWHDISLRNKPFTLTNVIVGLLASVYKLF